MRRTFTFISIFALMMSMLALPAMAKGQPVDLHCDPVVEGYVGVKAEIEDFEAGEFLFEGIEGTDGKLYDVLATLGADNKSVTFTVFKAGTDAVVSGAEVGFCLKGGPNNTGLQTGATGNTSGIPNRGGIAPEISYLMVYFVVPPNGGGDEVCRTETAWAANGTVAGEKRYIDANQWATYVEYNNAAKTVSVFAGQTEYVGTATLSPATFPDDGGAAVRIQISLTSDWSLRPGVDEPVKIQGYNAAPIGNPAPGQFTTYKGAALEVLVDPYGFYGIHLDVATKTLCTAPISE